MDASQDYEWLKVINELPCDWPPAEMINWTVAASNGQRVESREERDASFLPSFLPSFERTAKIEECPRVSLEMD